MTTLRIDRGTETVQLLGEDSRNAVLDELCAWLDEQPPEEIDGIDIGGVTLHMMPTLKISARGKTRRFGLFAEARDAFVHLASRDGDHWI